MRPINKLTHIQSTNILKKRQKSTIRNKIVHLINGGGKLYIHMKKDEIPYVNLCFKEFLCEGLRSWTLVFCRVFRLLTQFH